MRAWEYVRISIDENVEVVDEIVLGRKVVVKGLDPLVDIARDLNKLRLWPDFCHFMPAEVRRLKNHVILAGFDFVRNAGEISLASSILLETLDNVFCGC